MRIVRGVWVCAFRVVSLWWFSASFSDLGWLLRDPKRGVFVWSERALSGTGRSGGLLLPQPGSSFAASQVFLEVWKYRCMQALC